MNGTDSACSVEDCGRKTIAAGLCSSHYQRRLRGEDDWDRPIGPVIARPAHDFGRPCTVDGCGRVPGAAGLCGLHRQRRLSGDPDWADPNRRKGENAGCSVDGCPRAASARGLCALHYRRHRDQEPDWDQLETRPSGRAAGPPRECSIDGCHKQASAKGLCFMHYQRKKQNVENWDDPAEWRVRKPRSTPPVEQCRNGHPRTPENTLILADDKRRCRVCSRAAQKRSRPNQQHEITPDMHGTSTAYRYGCRCTDCREWHAEESRQWKRERVYGPGGRLGPDVRAQVIELLRGVGSVVEVAAALELTHQAVYAACKALPEFGAQVDELTRATGDA